MDDEVVALLKNISDTHEQKLTVKAKNIFFQRRYNMRGVDDYVTG